MPLIPAMLVVFVLLVAAIAHVLVGTLIADPSAIDLPSRYAPPWPFPGWHTSHPLGTDGLGRDLLSRLVVGAQLSLSVAMTVVFVGASVGTAIGVIAGYLGGWVDALAMRIVDVMLSFPAMLVALALVVTVGPGFWMVVVVLASYVWPQFARLVRAEVLVWKERAFVVIAKATGTSTPTILLIHILPNVLNGLVVLATLQVGWVIIAEAGLSFLGAGIPPPSPTWGGILAEGRDVMDRAWWLTLYPGLCITLIVLSFNVLGDWLRDALDPRLRQLAP